MHGMRSFLLSLLVAALASPSQAFLDCLKCPSDDSLDPKCLINIISPWPICLFYDLDYFLAKAVDGSSRCCGDDISGCRCPKKDTDKFKDRIGDWCKGVATCPQQSDKQEEEELVDVDTSVETKKL